MAGERPDGAILTPDEFAVALGVTPPFLRTRRIMGILPRDPRCKFCRAPFAGVGRLLRLTGYAPSRKNPNMCNVCFEKAPVGGIETEIGVLFADVRGFTSLAEALAPGEAAELLNRFYRVATDVLVKRDAIIDKLVGDEVMALFLPPLVGERYLEVSVEAGVDLLRGVGFGTAEPAWLPLGVGVDFGRGFVGNVGEAEIKDFTAVGDVVNTAARLQARASPGELVVSERVYEAVRDQYPDAPHFDLELKGKAAPVAAHVIRVGAAAPVPV